jgi:hypothetical protein
VGWGGVGWGGVGWGGSDRNAFWLRSLFYLAATREDLVRSDVWRSRILAVPGQVFLEVLR